MLFRDSTAGLPADVARLQIGQALGRTVGIDHELQLAGIATRRVGQADLA
jgi:hypothetical protein